MKQDKSKCSWFNACHPENFSHKSPCPDNSLMDILIPSWLYLSVLIQFYVCRSVCASVRGLRLIQLRVWLWWSWDASALLLRSSDVFIRQIKRMKSVNTWSCRINRESLFALHPWSTMTHRWRRPLRQSPRLSCGKIYAWPSQAENILSSLALGSWIKIWLTAFVKHAVINIWMLISDAELEDMCRL